MLEEFLEDCDLFYDNPRKVTTFEERCGGTAAVDPTSTAFDIVSIFVPLEKIKKIKSETNRIKDMLTQ